MSAEKIVGGRQYAVGSLRTAEGRSRSLGLTPSAVHPFTRSSAAVVSGTTGFRVQGSGFRKQASVRSAPRPSPLASRLSQPPTAYRLPPAAAGRRGVLLLVILSLLILFVMIAVTYVLVASRNLQANKSYARKDVTGSTPQHLLDGAAMQLVRGTNPDPSTQQFRSVIGPWSLLEHMYGMYTAQGTLDDQVTDSTGGQIVEFKVPTANIKAADPTFAALSLQSLNIDGFFDGSVITMTSGNAKNLTSRIVRYDATVTPPVFHILAFKGTAGNVTPQKGDTFIINGRAFSGTGFGFNSTTGTLDAKDTSTNYEYALLPNPTFFTKSATYPGFRRPRRRQHRLQRAGLSEHVDVVDRRANRRYDLPM